MNGTPLTDHWRLEHVKLGDRALDEAHKAMAILDEDGDDTDTVAVAQLIQVLISAAQAHYAAANVRARPGVITNIHGLQT